MFSQQDLQSQGRGNRKEGQHVVYEGKGTTKKGGKGIAQVRRESHTRVGKEAWCWGW